MTDGLFISFDGVDRAGKSTQIARLRDWLISQNHEVVTCRDPGGTALGEEVRSVLLTTKSPIGTICELLLYMASRAQLVEEVIQPALEAGKTVISDRYVLATIVYQGIAGGAPLEDIVTVANVATRGIYPDATILLDLDVETSIARATEPPDRMESRGREFLQAVRDGFLAEARKDDRISVIDASQTVDEVESSVRAAVRRILR